MKLCAIVVTYYPEVEETKKNIMRYLPWVDHLIIWENTPENDISSHKILLPQDSDKISYEGTGDNEGISYALNYAVEWALINGYTHLLTMDQDSYWDNFHQYLNEIKSQANNALIFAPLVNNKAALTPGLFITSGMIVSTDVYKRIGKYCKSFKVDVIDHEFCLRALNNGITFAEISNSNLHQNFGNHKHKYIFGKEINYAEYPPNRLEDIIKNYISILKKYPTPKGYANDIIRIWIIYPIIRTLLFDNNKIQKFKAIFKGILTGLFHKDLISI